MNPYIVKSRRANFGSPVVNILKDSRYKTARVPILVFLSAFYHTCTIRRKGDHYTIAAALYCVIIKHRAYSKVKQSCASYLPLWNNYPLMNDLIAFCRLCVG